LTTAFALALAAGCSSSCSKDELITAEVADSGLGDASDTGAADAPPGLACPSGLPGAELVRIDTAGGATYCMDRREVTQGEYQVFLAKKATDTSGQPEQCAWNQSYQQEYCQPNDDSLCYQCPADTPAAANDAAVNCIDFCDALAYCEWAGKRLCGRVGGPKKWGRVDVAVTEDAGPVAPQWDAVQKIAVSTDMEFQYACTQGGKTTYPYGDQYEAGKCIDADWVAANGSNSLGVTDLSNRSCTGTFPPFDQVYDLSGSVSEWQSLCGAAGGGLSCYLMGGSYSQYDATSLTCADKAGPTSIQNVYPTLGFRCCADAVQR
jgi:sulfatase modifying factor 1